MKNTTLLFLTKRHHGKIKELLLAMKKRGFGAGRWNGVGGKLHDGETIEQALIRETQEEINVVVSESDLKKVAELTFHFVHNPDFNQLVHVYTVDHWIGEPSESEEMKPQWYDVDAIPFHVMWPDDIFWVPHMIQDTYITARFVFGENDMILEKTITLSDL